MKNNSKTGKGLTSVLQERRAVAVSRSTFGFQGGDLRNKSICLTVFSYTQ